MRILAAPFSAIALALGTAPALSRTAHAQPAVESRHLISAEPPVDRIRGAWVSGAAGFQVASRTGGDGFVSSIGVHLQRDRVALSGRRDTMNAGMPNTVDAMGLLVGVAATGGFASAVLSAGMSNVDTKGYVDRQLGVHRHAMGATVTGENVSLRAGHRGGVGLGLTSFARFNSLQRFAGVGLEISVGRWR